MLQQLPTLSELLMIQLLQMEIPTMDLCNIFLFIFYELNILYNFNLKLFSYSITEYPINRAACEKKAITIMFTCPIFFDIFSAPYKNGILLIVATDTVIPINLIYNINFVLNIIPLNYLYFIFIKYLPNK